MSLMLDDYEFMLLDLLHKKTGKGKGEILRQSLWLARILFDPDLKLKDVVKEIDPEGVFAELMLPIPVLSNKISLELQLWQQITEKENNA